MAAARQQQLGIAAVAVASSGGAAAQSAAAGETVATAEPTVGRLMFAASVGAAATSLVVTPFEVARVKLQMQSGVHKMSTMDVLAQVARRSGVRSLWSGLTPSLLMAVPSAGVYYTIYHQLKVGLHKLQGPGGSEVLPPLLAGCTSRVFTVIVSSPFEVMRTNMFHTEGQNLGSVFRDLQRRGGPGVFFRGLNATIMRDAPFSAIYWSLYEFLKPRVSASLGRDSMGVPFLCGAGAGAVATVLTNPIDTVKTRLQVSSDAPGRGMRAPSAWGVFKDILKSEGLAGLNRGMQARLLRVPLSCAIMITAFEKLKG